MFVENYLHGECHIFAKALHLELGYTMQFAIDRYDLELEGEALIHAYCVSGDSFIDVRGRDSIENALEEFDYNDPMQVNLSIEDVDKLIKEGFVHEPEDSQIESLRKHIRENMELYV